MTKKPDDITFIKEFSPGNRYAVVRSKSYGKSFGFLSFLRAEVLKDFPYIEDDHIQVTYYSGRSYARTYGLEFRVPAGLEVPREYSLIQDLEASY